MPVEAFISVEDHRASVRNKLIEHPESPDSGITGRRWIYSTVDGPKVKDARRPGMTYTAHRWTPMNIPR